MIKWSKIALTLLMTLVFWLALGVVYAVQGSGSGATEFAATITFSATVLIWLGVGFPYLLRQDSPAHEKAKRTADSDPRLALLLELMDTNERQMIRERLIDDLDLNADGEMMSLADLLAAQEEQSQERRA